MEVNPYESPADPSSRQSSWWIGESVLAICARGLLGAIAGAIIGVSISAVAVVAWRLSDSSVTMEDALDPLIAAPGFGAVLGWATGLLFGCLGLKKPKKVSP